MFPKGSILLSGDIGSGKTTVLLAIEFALFGLQPSQKGSSLLRSDAEEGSVELECEIEGQTVIIARTLKKSRKSITQDYASITIGSEKFEESVSEIKSRVLKILNYPSEFSKKTNLLYKFTVYTPQEEMKHIILDDKESRLHIPRKVFDIDKYRRISDNAKLYSRFVKEQCKQKEGRISDLDSKKTHLENLLHLHKQLKRRVPLQ